MSPHRCTGLPRSLAPHYRYGDLVHLTVSTPSYPNPVQHCGRVAVITGMARVINRTVYRATVVWDLETDRPCGGEVRFNGYQVHLAPEAYTA